MEIDSICMNLAYRPLRRINWWPTYYVGFDGRGTGSHKDSFIELINDKTNGINKFVFYKENSLIGWKKNKSEFSLIEKVKNDFPYDKNAGKGSVSDFFIYQKTKLINQQ